MNSYICYDKETLEILCFITTKDELAIEQLEECFKGFDNKIIAKTETFLDNYLNHKVVLGNDGKIIGIEGI